MTRIKNNVEGNKFYWLETYGCQMNKAEAAAFELELAKEGYSEAQSPEAASLILLNTCAVRETAEERIWGRLGFFRKLKQKKPFKLIVTGCMSQRLGQDLKKKFPEIDFILDNFAKSKLSELLRHEKQNQIQNTNYFSKSVYQFAELHHKKGFKAFLPIMHGCNNFCSYCVVPLVRGPEISRSPQEIIAEIRRLEEKGVLEVTLLGQNVNSYRYNTKGQTIFFPDLLDLIEKEVSNIRWIRFLTSHPKDCSLRLIEKMASSKLICRHLHLPVQHGSNRILQLMNRGYSRESYLKLVADFKNIIRGISITTDILIGFPSETDEDFKLTMELLEEVKFGDAYTYYYNPRLGTKAYELEGDLPLELKLERLHKIVELVQRLKIAHKQTRLGETVTALVEEKSKKNAQELLARTEQDEMAVFTGNDDLIGKFVKLKLLDLKGITYQAYLV